VIYDLLFKVPAETMLTIAADPKHLGARIGITSVPPVFIGFLAWGRLAIPGIPASWPFSMACAGNPRQMPLAAV